MKKLKVNFVDFWPNFYKTDNYFYNLLNTKYDIEIDEEDPDILFFSVDFSKKRERNKYKNHRSKKVFFTGENVRPNFEEDSIEYPNYSIGKCDISFSFDYSINKKNYRFPLWAFFINWFDKEIDENRDPSYLIPLNHIVGSNQYKYRKQNSKTEFCNFLFSNPSGERINILNTLEKYKKITCSGKLKNNTGHLIAGRGDQVNKLNFLSNFKFTIAAENSKYDGYTTEKIIHPLSVGSIPIYWGSDKVNEDFNEKAFINANNISYDELFNKVKEIDENNELYEKIINEPVFINDKIPNYLMPENVLKFIETNILC